MKLAVNGRFLAAQVTGVQRFARELLKELVARAEVTLFLPSDAEVPETPECTVVRGSRRGHVWEQTELPGLVGAAGMDVVLHPANTAPLRSQRSVVIVHDPMFALTNPEWFTGRYALWQKRVIAPALRRANRILTVSEWSRVHLAAALGVPEARVGVVPQGLAPFDRPASATEVDRVRGKYALPAKYVIAFGGADPRKNIRFMDPVMAELASLREDAHLVIIGDAYQRVHRRDEPTERANVQILGQLGAEDTHPLLTGASAMCFPSLAEGFGRPPLEALACGTPALVGPYACAREVLGDAGTILPWNAAAWAGALHDLLDDPNAQARALAQAEPLKARYNWSACADGVMEACESGART